MKIQSQAATPARPAPSVAQQLNVSALLLKEWGLTAMTPKDALAAIVARVGADVERATRGVSMPARAVAFLAAARTQAGEPAAPAPAPGKPAAPPAPAKKAPPAPADAEPAPGKCSTCGAIPKPGARYCDQCGASLAPSDDGDDDDDDDAAPPPAPGKAPPPKDAQREAVIARVMASTGQPRERVTASYDALESQRAPRGSSSPSPKSTSSAADRRAVAIARGFDPDAYERSHQALFGGGR